MCVVHTNIWLQVCFVALCVLGGCGCCRWPLVCGPAKTTAPRWGHCLGDGWEKSTTWSNRWKGWVKGDHPLQSYTFPASHISPHLCSHTPLVYTYVPHPYSHFKCNLLYSRCAVPCPHTSIGWWGVLDQQWGGGSPALLLQRGLRPCGDCFTGVPAHRGVEQLHTTLYEGWVSRSSSATKQFCGWWRPSRSKRPTINLLYCYVNCSNTYLWESLLP